MSRFDRRLKGTNEKNKSSGGSGAACVPQPIPKRAPLLSGMMFGNRINNRGLNTNSFSNVNQTVTKGESLDDLVNEVDKTKTNGAKISDNNIKMIHRRLSRLENINSNISIKTNKVYERLEKRLNDLEEMYGKNMESMEKYVNNQQDSIINLSGEYKATLQKLNMIVESMNKKIIELSEKVYSNDEETTNEETTNEETTNEETTNEETTNEESKNEDTKKEVSSAIEEVTGDLNIKEEVENISKPLKKIVVSDKIENKDIISEIMDEVKSKVVENTNSKNITLEIVEN